LYGVEDRQSTTPVLQVSPTAALQQKFYNLRVRFHERGSMFKILGLSTVNVDAELKKLPDNGRPMYWSL
jgi:hypothetical protein